MSFEHETNKTPVKETENKRGGEKEINPKEHAIGLFAKHSQNNGKRHNKKESKRRGYRIRQLRKLKAHAGEEALFPGNLCSEKPGADESSNDIPLNVEVRNEVARAALEAPDELEKNSNDEEFQDMISSFTSFVASENVPDADAWISYIENILLYAWHLKKAEGPTDILVATMSYIKMCTSKSITMTILKVIEGLLNKNDEPLGSNALSGDSVVRGWDAFRANPIFNKISYLISAAMSVSACSIKKIEWNPCGFEFISIEAMKEQAKAVDVIDAVLRTFTWMMETGYKCITTRSLVPLLFGDQKMRDFQETCDYVLAHQTSYLSGNGGDLGPFEKKVDDCLHTISEMKKTRPDTATAHWLQQKYAELVLLKEKIVGKHRNTAQRPAPFGVGITGSSGIGKTTLGTLTMKVTLEASGFEYDEKRIITEDQNDKYDSLVTSDIIGIFNDDVGQSKKEFTSKSVAGAAVKRVNNVPAQAVKAELHEKNCVFYRHIVDIMTSNFSNYNMHWFSDTPQAGLRRYVHVRARVLEKYRVPGGVALNTDHPDLDDGEVIHDVWNLDIEECLVFESKTGTDSYKFQIMTVTALDGEKIYCKDLNLKQYLKAIAALAKRHREKQLRNMEDVKRLAKVVVCKTTFIPEQLCDCTKCIEKRAIVPVSVDKPLKACGLEEVIINAGSRAIRNYIESWWAPVRFANSLVGYTPINKMATKQLTQEFSHILRDEVTPLMVAVTPEWLFQTKIFQRSVDFWQRSAALYSVKKHLKAVNIACPLAMIAAYASKKKRTSLVIAGLQMVMNYVLWSHYRARIRVIKEEYQKRRDVVPSYAKEWMESNAVKGTLAVVATGVMIKFLMMWNRNRVKNLEANSSLSVDSIAKTESWFGSLFKFTTTKASAKGDTTGVMSDDMVKAFKKNNLFFAEFTFSDGRKAATNIFFPRKNVAIIPYHVYFKGSKITRETPNMDIRVKVFRHDSEAGGIHEFRCDSSTSVVSKQHDMVMLWTPKCPDYIDRSDWLVSDRPKGSGYCHFVCKTRNDVENERVYVTYKNQQHADWEGVFWGGRYQTSIAKPGTCMGLLLADVKKPSIVGFHIAGSDSEGSMQTLTHSEYTVLLKALEQQPSVLLSSQAVAIPKEQYGRPLLVSDKPHPKSMAAKLKPEDSAIVLGSTRLRTKQRSEVEQSILSDNVAKYFGVPNKWGPPKLEPNWAAYNANLEHIINPGDMFPPKLLERARRDWVDPLKDAMREFVKSDEVRPLTLKESILGINGKRFLDALPMETSMGFPIFGPKKRWFEEIREGEKLIDRIPHEDVQKELDRLHDAWMRGERGYPVTSATLKDEPTEQTSTKVRVFQASCVAMSIWIRTYFLPIARFLQFHPVLAESAVGINAFGTQWQDLIDAATRFNKEMLLALDHSKFDVRMNCQVTIAVWRSFLELAEVAGYDKQSLYVMKMMLNDITNPLIDFNGTLLLAMSMNTSGNNLTVNVNGCANSLYIRMAFFTCYTDEQSFRACVAIITYGDDLIGSVAPQFRKFTFRFIKKFLAEFGLKITPPTKTEEEMDYLPFEEADFLKRTSNYIPDIDRSIGRLCKDSIFKSLHVNLRSKNATKREVAISCIDGAMHEMFAHGKEEFLDFQSKMMLVCKEVDLTVPSVTASWDERVQHWLSKYCPDGPSDGVIGVQAQAESCFMTAESGCYAKTQY
jgi:ABC-type oligopeptide transport system ATPase subunit